MLDRVSEKVDHVFEETEPWYRDSIEGWGSRPSTSSQAHEPDPSGFQHLTLTSFLESPKKTTSTTSSKKKKTRSKKDKLPSITSTSRPVHRSKMHSPAVKVLTISRQLHTTRIAQVPAAQNPTPKGIRTKSKTPKPRKISAIVKQSPSSPKVDTRDVHCISHGPESKYQLPNQVEHPALILPPIQKTGTKNSAGASMHHRESVDRTDADVTNQLLQSLKFSQVVANKILNRHQDLAPLSDLGRSLTNHTKVTRTPKTRRQYQYWKSSSLSK